MATEHPVQRTRLQSMLLVAGVSLAAALVITGTYEISHERILENERMRLLANLNSVVDTPRGSLPVALEIPVSALPGNEHVLQLFAMHEDSELIAWVYSAVAPAGYNGPIEFLLGVSPGDEIIRVRITRHRETPGLGDAIEAAKSDWLRQFENRHLADTPAWAVRTDGGDFDALTGATVTPRAVVAAIGAVVQYHASHKDELLVLSAGTSDNP